MSVVPKKQELASHLSDTGNAARFVRHHRGGLLYCEGTGWLLHDGTRWRPAGGEVVRLAKDTVAQIYQEAGRYRDDERRRTVTRWALASEGEKRINSMIALARCELPVSADALDQDPWL